MHGVYCGLFILTKKLFDEAKAAGANCIVVACPMCHMLLDGQQSMVGKAYNTAIPSKVPDEYNAGMSKRKSIYIPFAQAIPRVATIDAAHCLYLTKSKCGVCSKVCGFVFHSR